MLNKELTPRQQQ
jgi:hypothetical protein